MAQIRARKNKNGVITSYTITVFLGRDNNGKKIQCNKSVAPEEIKAKTPKAIEKELEYIASEYEREVIMRPLDHSKDTFKQYANYYLNRKEKTGQQCFTTLQRNRERLDYKVYPIIGDMKIADIKPIVISDALEKIESGECDPRKNAGKISAVTVKDVFVLMNSIFEDACINEVIPKNPCANCRKDLPKAQSNNKTKFWEINQARIFLKLFENDTLMWQVYFDLSLASACRREEILGLRYKDIDYKRGVISITNARVRDNDGEKGKKYADKDPKSIAGEREIPILPEVLEMLKKYESSQKKHWFALRSSAWIGESNFNDNYVFASQEGKELSIDAPLRKMKRKINNYNKTIEAEDQKLPVISLHSLRHTTASILENNGLPYSVLQEFLGHSKTKSVTGIYTHALKGSNEKIFEILSLIFKPEEEQETQAKTI